MPPVINIVHFYLLRTRSIQSKLKSYTNISDSSAATNFGVKLHLIFIVQTAKTKTNKNSKLTINLPIHPQDNPLAYKEARITYD